MAGVLDSVEEPDGTQPAFGGVWGCSRPRFHEDRVIGSQLGIHAMDDGAEAKLGAGSGASSKLHRNCQSPSNPRNADNFSSSAYIEFVLVTQAISSPST